MGLWTGSIGRVGMISKLVRQVFPLVNQELAEWRRHASVRCSPELAAQALASIRDKKFHCQGGSAFSLYPGVTVPAFVRFVVALQTISDYLDNLCDRAGFTDEQAFRQLHLAMTDALDPAGPVHDYYACYPYRSDGGYLRALVEASRREVARLPSYPLVKAQVLRLAGLYSELQTYKHLDAAVREAKIAGWGAEHLAAYPGLTLWEFGAACGSTLGLFMLCAAGANPQLRAEEVRAITDAYFPWVCGMHILLDYLIDLAEDREHNELNFIAYYPDVGAAASRLAYFRDRSLAAAESLPEPQFTATIIYGLLAMYLSDPKTQAGQQREVKEALLSTAGRESRVMYKLCRLLRRQGLL
ncbi:MAG TPA: tetraprenyl-beta-curcumene synthase family protein [Selenomonadales bacterium]|nr:tetraprenyl-beta-curcumene synthase family protein [Selenomonadales bacterium]